MVKRQSLDSYLKTMSQYRFVLSPPGFGYDCFRTWEALALGCVPIVFRDRNYDMRLFTNQPIWQIDDIQQLELDFPDFSQTDNDMVYLPYWKQLFST